MGHAHLVQVSGSLRWLMAVQAAQVQCWVPRFHAMSSSSLIARVVP
jgi:hypothetical protein